MISSPFYDNGNTPGLLGGFHLVSENYYEEESYNEIYHLYELINGLSIGIFKSTRNGNILHANNYMAKLLGFGSAENLIGSGQNIANELFENPARRKEIMKELQEKEDFVHFITILENRQNQELKLKVTVRALKDQSGEMEVLEGFVHDESEKDNYLDKLERSKADLDAILHNVSKGYILFNSDYTVKTLNTQAAAISEKIWGREVREGMDFREILFGNYPDSFLKNFDEALNGREIRLEHQPVIRNEQYNFVFTYSPVFLKNNLVDSVVLSVDDITSYKRIEGKLNNTIEELENIFENSMTGILVVDRDRYIRKLNQQTEKIFGYTKDELLNAKTDIIHKDHQNYLEFRKYYRQILKQGAVYDVNFPFRHKNGRELLLQFTGKYLEKDPATGSAMIIWNLRDITDDYRNRKINNAVFKISQTFHKDENLSVLLEEMQSHLSQILNVRNLFVAFYDEARDNFTLPFMSDLHDNFSSVDAEYTISGLVVKENRSYFLKTEDINKLCNKGKVKIKGTSAKVWIGVPMRVKGKPIGVIVVQDYNDENAYSQEDLNILEFLSDQISMSIHRKRNDELLRENIDTKNKIFSIIAHDLKSPFNSLIGLSSLLKEGSITGEDDRQEIYENLHHTAKEGYALLDNLLLWTRSQLGQMDHQEEELKLAGLVEEVFQQMNNAAVLKDIHLVNKVPDTLSVWGDNNKLQTVVRNLISNSLKYSEKGSSIEVSAYESQKDVVITVVDYGIGMSQDMAEKLFSPGFDNRRPGTDKEKGTGLGLLISREFVEHHKGKIWAESEKGKGSKFSFTIPLRQSSKKHYERVEYQENKYSGQDETPLQDLNILVVEDVEVNYVLLKKMLNKLGATVAHAWDGQEATDYCDHKKPDAVLMDINMPIMDGVEATRIIKQKDSAIPVVIQTAYDNEKNQRKSREAGADGYLEKPIMKDKLLQILLNLV